MKQPAPRGGLAVVFTVLQEAVLVLAVNPTTRENRNSLALGGRALRHFWSENDAVTPAASSPEKFFLSDLNVNISSL